MSAPDIARVITGEVRLSYEHLVTPRADPTQPNAVPKYSATLLIPKADIATKQAIDAALQAAHQEGVTKKWGANPPVTPPIPLYDGDGARQDGNPFPPEARGHWVISASSKAKPQVVDLNLQPIIDPNEIYSGMYIRASIRFFAYNTNNKRGIGCGLNNVQKLRDGERLGGGTNAADDFATPPGVTPGYPAAAPAPAYPAAAPAPTPAYPTTAAPAYPVAPPTAPTYQAPGAYAAPPPTYPAAAAPAVLPQAAAPAAVNPITGLPMTGPVMGIG